MTDHTHAADDAPTCKNDLYAYLGMELRHFEWGRCRGTLRRVRAAYDFCEFEVPGGKMVRRPVEEVLTAIDNGYVFVEPEVED